jgi:hypothetical protein
MEASSERVSIKFCLKAIKTATETVEMVHAAYGDEALMRSNVFRGYGRYREGREDVQYDPRSCRPSEFRTEGNIEKIRQLLLQNRHCHCE